MPNYEYECDRCHTVRTENLKMDEADREFVCDKEVEPPDPKKPKCGGTMKRIISLNAKMGHQWMP
jgi:hypothetical protein